ncbi:hypothetical protein HID58_094949 [Brassica napus]|uniref:Uncharacterized protein n=1 Tax=Brassica napus TaxID=3708 RepID=A0ABQ7X5D3_BRANA|nr:hypothetical protein HID58_094949 [Brassica napus]
MRLRDITRDFGNDMGVFAHKEDHLPWHKLFGSQGIPQQSFTVGGNLRCCLLGCGLLGERENSRDHLFLPGPNTFTSGEMLPEDCL